jgi:TolB protein
MAFPVLADGQRAQVRLGGPAHADSIVLWETTDMQVEAPNWSLDGTTLYLNGNGRFWALSVNSPESGLRPIEYDGIPDLNNDHVLDPDGKHVFLSAMDGHIHHASLTGGRVTRVSPDDGSWHFLHGVSPDGKRLAYVEIAEPGRPGRLVVTSVSGGSMSRIDTGAGHLDGPEWAPDGDWIYFNTESFTSTPGHAQLARIPDAGGAIERLLVSESVDWFPHLSPNGRSAAYISFPLGTLGHPGDLDVQVKVVATDDWSTPLQCYPLFGGQGTLNVNSWSPDSTQFAFVAYPMA